MRAGVDSLVDRMAEVAPMDAEEVTESGPATVQESGSTGLASTAQNVVAKSGKAAPASTAAKSVRIALSRLDRMMNTVGELVINRTRMLGRVTELERLRDTLGFSKERLQGKVAEFHRINSVADRLRPATPQLRKCSLIPRLATLLSGMTLASSKWIATTTSTYSRVQIGRASC